ncbi:ABC transporter permease [Exiguobacterium sp. s78]|uniref:ABC transporter permease n=1 Tax=Exiguobacterium sp. s78 TaxID=2751197 RepID=UPI001BECF058|nr:ABC transporter permease [Exiguobacterium sp. s78]
MFRFVLNQWRRQRGKFILTLVGALIISAGLSLMFNLTDSSQGTVEQTLQKKWSSAYDIVVRPKGSQMSTESNDLLEPNYLNSITGGISFAQYEKIKQIEDVDIAAPVAVIGYANIGLTIKDQMTAPKAPGFYRISRTEYSDSGLKKEKLFTTNIHAIKSDVSSELRIPNLDNFFVEDINPSKMAMIVAIDPEQEARLVGLDKSVKKSPTSRYFEETDQANPTSNVVNGFTLPILINPNTSDAGYTDFKIERLDLPFKTEQQQTETIDRLQQQSELQDYLGTIKSKTLETKRISAKRLDSLLFNALAKPDSVKRKELEVTSSGQLLYRTGALNYTATDSPFPKRWSQAYSLNSETLQTDQSLFDIPILPSKGYRPVKFSKMKVKDTDTKEVSELTPTVDFDVIGLFDPKKITVSKDPLNELPLETYRPATANLVLDATGKPINPSPTINSSNNPVDLLTGSPNILTTLNAAQLINGKQSISSIRLKISGAKQMGEKSEQLLQDVKQQIERETGLIATITKGSSPQPVVTKVIDDGKTLGWIEQPLIHIGAAMTIFRETSVGFSGVIFAMLAVAIVYVLATSYVSMLARRKEFAVLLALGWRTKDLYKIVLIEAAILAGLVSTIALIVEGIFSYVRNEAMNGWSLLWIALFSLVIYLAGAAWSAWTIRRISPYEAIKTGEYAKAARVGLKLRSTATLALKELIGKWKRNSLSVLSIALPTALLTFFLFVTFHLQGVLYTSWLGQFVALQVGPMHYVTMGIAITIAILTTGEIMWQNVTDRRASLAVLKALGWTNGAIRQLIVLEGFLVGLISGIIGLIVAYSTIYVLYDLVPWNEPLLIGVSLSLPILFGVIAAFIPAQLAARVQPYQELKDAS